MGEIRYWCCEEQTLLFDLCLTGLSSESVDTMWCFNNMNVINFVRYRYTFYNQDETLNYEGVVMMQLSVEVLFASPDPCVRGPLCSRNKIICFTRPTCLPGSGHSPRWSCYKCKVISLYYHDGVHSRVNILDKMYQCSLLWCFDKWLLRNGRCGEIQVMIMQNSTFDVVQQTRWRAVIILGYETRYWNLCLEPFKYERFLEQQMTNYEILMLNYRCVLSVGDIGCSFVDTYDDSDSCIPCLANSGLLLVWN